MWSTWLIVGEFEDGVGWIERLQHMHRQPALVELQRLRPVLQRDHAVDVLVAPLFIQGAVDGEPVELQHVDAGQPRRRQGRQHLPGGDAQRLVQRLGILPSVSMATTTIGLEASWAATSDFGSRQHRRRG